MRICYLGNATSVHTERWAGHFARLGHPVTVASLAQACIPGVDVQCIGPDPNLHGRLAYVAAIPRFRRLVRDWRPDLIHAHYAGGYGFIGALSGFRPTILTAWGSDVLILPQTSFFMRKLVRLALRRADLITSMADHMTEVICQLGVRPERVLTLPFGVDTALFHPCTASQPAGNGGPTIVSTRHLEPLYNVGLLIEAMPAIASCFPNVRLLLIGDGSERGRLRDRAAELNLDRHVTFLGRRRPPEVAEFLAQADLFVSTSLSDGNNISLNEAMACGVFPIASDIPANREWIQHGQNGFLTGVHDPLALAELAVEALGCPQLREQAATLNWNIIQERGSWGAAMEIMEERYRELISTGESAVSIRGAAGVSL